MRPVSRRAARRVRLFSLLTLLVLTGCGSGSAVVSGTVTYRGKPVPGGSVILYCSDKQIVRGTIGPDGRYTIPNVPAGSAVVTVQTHARVPAGLKLRQNLPPSVDSPTPPAAATSADGAVLIPPRYALPEESGLVVVIDRGQVAYDIDLKP